MMIVLCLLIAILTACQCRSPETYSHGGAVTGDSARALKAADTPAHSVANSPSAKTGAPMPRKFGAKKPILHSAWQNARFDPKTWLESDRLFYLRTSPSRLSDYDDLIKKMARRYGFDWRFIAAQIFAESNFKWDAQSPSGAMGLMQVLPGTAEFMGYDPTDLLTPATNIAVGCLYNRRQYTLWGRQTKDHRQRLAFSLASYNAGRRKVLRAYSRSDSLNIWRHVYPHLPLETQDYVHKIYLKWDLYRRHVLP